MSDQVQCPNCGGYKTEEKDRTMTYGAPIPLDESRKKGCHSLWLRSSVFLIIGVVIVSMIFFADHQSTMALFVLMIYLPGALLGSGVLWLMRFWYMRTSSRPVEDVVYSYCCWICGYRWNWQSGTPLPVVNVRPDLIAKGEQRLRAEQEAYQDRVAHEMAELARRQANMRK